MASWSQVVRGTQSSDEGSPSKYGGGRGGGARPVIPSRTHRIYNRSSYPTEFPAVVRFPRARDGEQMFPCSYEILDVEADGNCCFRVMAMIL